MDYTLIVIIIIGVALLGLMASQIDITLEPQEINPIPKILIKFRKDSSFFNFIRSTKVVETNGTIDPNEPYINEIMIGEAYINYGDDAATLLHYDLNLKANETLSEYHYYNGDPNARIKRTEGFTEKDRIYKTLKKFDSWNGSIKGGVFSNLYRITLPINKVFTGGKTNLKFNLELFGHYREFTKNVNISYCFFYFRCLNTTNNTILKFVIPKGEKTKISKFELISRINNTELLNYELNSTEGLNELPNNYGLIWIRKSKEHSIVQWEIPKKSPIGTIFELKWYNEVIV